MSTVAAVNLWGTRIGAVALEDDATVASFAYDPDFVRSGVEVSPLHMPLAPGVVYRFPELSSSFHGLPGLLAEALPDRYGNTLIDAWLATQGRTPESFNAVERLCYTGARGMGALEFAPALGPRQTNASAIDVDALVALASEVLSQRDNLHASFSDPDKADALRDILRVGTSAGGARAKAVIAWNEQTNEVRSGQVDADPGFTHWLLKFDGVQNNRDKELADPQGYGAVEYAYASMARAAGIDMSECRLLAEGGRRHFMTRRFDRPAAGGKLHMQSLASLAHYDFNDPNAYSYEQALLVMRRLGLPMAELEQQVRRMLFNVVARNQDDHVKNIAFLMDKRGVWRLAPAFDVTWAYNPQGAWTGRHQMSVNGKRDGFTRDDLEACARSASVSVRRTREMLRDVLASVSRWAEFADEAEVAPRWRDAVASTLRLGLG
ncbi:MAG: type II toxin-antitoxin system HipA family toxin [Myxococcales bacterium]|nr:type II toxin-antitoxin system HipA family toxin [Myxococcales bacterium]MCB9626109.1 type II toxin-antitoxin system HipA family toxin [Sandaracinaceae bacterium]